MSPPDRAAAARRSLAGAVLLALSLLAGCTSAGSAPDAEASPPPFADCAGLIELPTAGPGGAATDRPPLDGSVPAGAVLPDLRLRCFTGGAEFSLSGIHGPAVVNLWASWCPPCVKELPAFQRLAREFDGKLHVVGVNTGDDRESAAALGNHLGLTFPMLVDRDEKLRIQLSAANLPVTVFIDRQGRVRHVHLSGALDDNQLRSLVERHLGVAVGL